MNARQACLRHYSGGGEPKCLWCGSTKDLEIDHISGGQGQGTAHRRDMASRGTNINYELRRLGYPPGYQILCHECHLIRSYAKELKPMAATASGDEKSAKNFYLRRDVITQIEQLAKEKGIAPSQLIEDWTLTTTDGADGHQQKLLGVLHDRHTALTAAVEALGRQVDLLGGRMAQLDTRMAALGLKADSTKGVLDHIIDTLKRLEAWTQKGWFKR